MASRMLSRIWLSALIFTTVVSSQKGGTVRMLAYPMLIKNQPLDAESYSTAITSLKRDHDIDLIVDFTEYDIYQIDVVWPGEFGDKFLDLAPFIPESLKNLHNPQIYNANNLQGRQVAVPFFADYGTVFYRTDLLEKYNYTGPPETWDEMESMMAKIVPEERKTNPMFFGYVGQLNAYEGLTCNFLEWIASNDGGYIVDQFNLSVTVNNPNAGYSPLASLVYDEPLTERMWLSGNTLFIRLWATMIFNTMTSKTFPKDARGNPAFNMVRIPGKTKNLSGATLGGFQLAVNKFTRNVNASVKAVQAMMTREFQVKRLEMTKVWPTIPSIYGGYGNPSSQRLQRHRIILREVYLAVNKILRDDMTASQGLRDLSISVAKALGGTKIPQHSQVHQVTFVHFSDPAGIVFMTISGILAIANIVLFIVIFLNRTNRVLSAASPLFLLMMVAGTLIGHAAIYVYTGRPSSLKCVLQPWFVVGGYSVTVAALISRTWRIYQIFRNPYSMIQVTNPELLKTWVYLTALNIFLLVLWTFFNAPAPALSRNTQTGWIMIGLLFTYNALMLGGAVFLTSRTRRVQGPFNEARYVGYAVYTMVLVDVILIMALVFNRVDRSHISHSVIKTQSFPACQIESMESARTTGKTHGGSARVLPPGVKAGANENGYTQVVDGDICARWATMRWMLGFTSWKAVRISIIPASKLMFLYFPQNDGSSHAPEKDDLGLAIQVRSVMIEDVMKKDEFLFDVTVNGVFYQFQVGCEERKRFWMDVLASLDPSLKCV
ncbi:hypothetical protein BC829DRAFT_446074 [Chytridium lagenaria]|nr:hypothetical protein BC829DRAFT_446074 [Chytridium lagenaria]